MTEAQRLWVEENRKRVREISKRCYWKNRESNLARQKKWREQNQDKLKKWREENKDRLAAAGRKHEYGMTQEAFDQMFQQQEGKCAICGCLMESPHVDHNHITGEIRKLLCRKCNSILGFANDSIEILGNAIQYLEAYNVSR